MYKLIRYFNQNRKKILIIIFLIISAFVLLNMMNDNAKENNQKMINQVKTQNNVEETVNIVNKDFDLSGNKKTTQMLKNDKEAIDKFIKYCNEGDISNAYNMLSDDCKEVMYNTEEIFKKNYYLQIFGNGSKEGIVENWNGNTYMIKFQEDILASGKLQKDGFLTDYITTTTNDENEKKLNISSFIKKAKVEKNKEYYGLNTIVNYKYVFMDYEIYNITFKNSTDNKILIDELNDSKTMYIEDKDKAKYNAYNHELAKERLVIRANSQSTVDIKYSNIYRSDKIIKKIVFSDVIYKYEDINYKDEVTVNL